MLISDGVDSYSKHKFLELKKTLSQSDILVYSFGTLNPYADQIDGGRETLDELSRISGGKAYVNTQLEKIDEIFQVIYAELKWQYTIGFTPTIANGKYNKIKVILSPERAKEIIAKEPAMKGVKLKGRTREGYFAK